MKYSDGIGCLLLLLLANQNIVSGQFCTFDFNNYDKSGNYSITDFSHWWSWISCQDSYVIDSSRSKFISIKSSFTQINCQTNNLILTDSNGKVFDFCNGTGKFTFTTRNVEWIKIERVRKCSFSSCYAPQTLFFELNFFDEPPTSWLPDKCGLPAIPPTLAELRIINGIDAVPNSWPWQALVLTLKIDPWNKQLVKQYLCGASLISNQWLITAAHCYDEDAAGVFVYLGLQDANDVFSYSFTNVTSELKTRKIIPHPMYNDTETLNDIALIKLREPVNFTKEVSPVCMPGGRSVKEGDKLMVTGWGTTAENGDISYILQQTDVQVNPPGLCVDQFGLAPLVSGQLCAGIVGPSPHDSCQGDSGGPLVRRDENGKFWLVGIVSMGVGCRGHGIYTNVVEYEEWVLQTIRDNM